MQVAGRAFPPSGRAAILMTGLLLAACTSPRPASPPATPTTPAASPSPKVVVTAHVALLQGELVLANGCVQVKSNLNPGQVRTLAWPPDAQATISGQTVTVTTGIVSGSPVTITLHAGDMVSMGGGEAGRTIEGSGLSVEKGCPGPYWAVGLNIGREPNATPPVAGRLSQRDPDLRGIIIRIHRSDGDVSALSVEGTQEAGIPYARAMVGLDAATRIGTLRGGDYAPADLSALREGQRVDVWFAGPILTSDPVQATAQEVVIVESTSSY